MCFTPYLEDIKKFIAKKIVTIMNKNIILYAAILIFGVVAPFVLPAFKVQLSILMYFDCFSFNLEYPRR
jgi:hypothetical protein